MWAILSLNPFGTGRGLSTNFEQDKPKREDKSQSLWNRAGSFDLAPAAISTALAAVSIPLEQGGVFRRGAIDDVLRK